MSVSTLCHCWKLLRADGEVFGFTDHDRTLQIDGISFEPQTGFSASEARHALGLAVDAMDISGALTSARISAEEIELGLYDGAQIETWLVDWLVLAKREVLSRTVIGRITRKDGAFTAELLSPIAALDRPGGRYYRRTCDAELGDAACGFNLAAPGFTASGTVISVENGNVLSAFGLASFAEDWFSLGWLHPEAGAPVRVLTHRLAGALAVLTLERGVHLAPATAFTIHPGCDKRFATCKAKFGNGVNFRGFPHLPGNDAAYAYVREDQIFDGGALVP